MRLGYNTNGFAHHRLEDALDLLHELGYRSVALTLDYHALDPFTDDFAGQRERVRTLLQRLELASVVETGARFLLDPRRKHQPTLLDPDPALRARRYAFLEKAIDLAAALGSEAVSFWSGARPAGESDAACLSRLVEQCRRLAARAQDRRVRLAFEPEPGMFIATLADYQPLHSAVAHPHFGLTIDIGHLHCQGEDPIPDRLWQWRDCLWNIHIEDMRRGVHDHLPFGAGEIAFPPILQTLHDIGYSGGVHVELSRHSHDAVETARRSIAFLRACMPGL